ncbi:MAG TPA: hypothetical protein PLN33_06640 [Hyphomonadaceae bacterium]|nr:hypothetical protein [Hyphomonadaceae bacterium]
MTTGLGEAFLNARHSEEPDGDMPARTETAEAAGSVSDAFAVPEMSGTKCLDGQLPEWPEAALYVYL